MDWGIEMLGYIYIGFLDTGRAAECSFQRVYLLHTVIPLPSTHLLIGQARCERIASV